MSALRRGALGLAHVLLAVGVGGGLATLATVALDDHRDAQVAASARVDDVPLGDRLEAALAGVRDDGVYVADDGRSLVSPEGEAQIEAAVAAQPVPTYVFVWSQDAQIGMDDLLRDDLLGRALDDRDGFVLVWEGPGEGSVFGVGPDGGYADFSSLDFVGDPATTISQLVASISPDDLYGSSSSDDGGGDYWGGVAGGSTLGALAGLAVVGVVGGPLALVRRRRGHRLLPGGWAPWGSPPPPVGHADRKPAKRPTDRKTPATKGPAKNSAKKRKKRG
jgi:hypothetical protein